MLFSESDFQERETFFIEVVLPLSLGINYTYRVPYELNSFIEIGKRVVVQFGKHRIYTAIIKRITKTPPRLYEAKYIIDVVDNHPVVNEKQFLFWDWISSYYLCNQGDVMAAALPSGLKLASETILMLHEDKKELDGLNERELLLVQTLDKKQRLSIDDVINLFGQKSIYPIVNKLIDKEIIIAFEEVIDKYKPLLKSFLKLHDYYREEENLKQLFIILEKAPKQLNALLAYLKLSKENGVYVAKSDVLEQAASGQAALKALIDKNIFLIDKRQVSRLTLEKEQFDVNFKLSTAQEKALEEIKSNFKEKEVVLLHGITSSGKTQLYIKLIEEAIAKDNGQVLFLLPEIALTTQIVERIKLYFGSLIGVYHSKFNDQERVEIWNKVNNGSFQVVLGARSAVFLPFNNLRLIVVDEEHESSYKQHDPAPRYQARDAAIYLAHLHQSKVLLGSATPSIESYYNTQIGKYGLVTLNERFGGVQLPQQSVVSMADEMKEKKMVSYFTSVLLDNINTALHNKEQIILFQNRRGYATILICATCGYAPKCINCDVSLTYHKSSGKLHCHYCGYYQNSMNICPACGSVHIMHKGFGTERIEEELSILYPDVKIARLDLDSAKTKNAMQQIITQFQDKKTDILIGTQMVAKGLDFDNVSLIGVINADTLLNFPDFRAFERSFQLLAQVAGRAGRRDKQGQVCIQTYAADHRILDQVLRNDYQAMYQTELQEREQFHYPPFSRLIFLLVKHRDADILNDAAIYLANELKAKLGKRVIGPEQPLVTKVRSYYLQRIMVKVERNAAMPKVKEVLISTIIEFNAQKPYKSVQTVIDVDPY